MSEIAAVVVSVPRLSSNSLVRMLGSSFVASITGRLVRVAMGILLARQFGPEGFGAFTFALGTGQLMGRFGGAGWPTLMSRFIPQYKVASEFGKLRGLLLAADRVVWVVSIGLTIFVISVTLCFAQSSRLSVGVIAASLLAPLLAFRSLKKNQLAALGLPGLGLALEELVAPILVCAGVIVAIVPTVDSAIALFAIGSFIAVLLGAKIVRQRCPRQTYELEPVIEFRYWWSTALPCLIGMSAKLMMNKTDVLMLAPLSTFDQVGLYGSALRITYLQTTPAVLVSTVLAPMISSALAKSDCRTVARLFWGGLGAAALLSVPIAAALVSHGESVVSFVYGGSYLASFELLVPLTIGQAAAAMGVSTTALMLMSGHQNTLGKITVLALALNVAGNLVVIPAMNGYGAAIVTAWTAVGLFGVQLFFCCKILGDLCEANGE